MKPYGKSDQIRNGCPCCSISLNSRQEAKNELRKLIEEELDDLPPESCKVCGLKDYKCGCFEIPPKSEKIFKNPI